ncbi:GPI ethanolamine phosphate transferase 1-like [Lineus longissimus]|uniref:GPI ethanolamine phosphate transferase 1-like n=1 Tax=Lineus longissimus TaxID=88925 RepID=UPI002B4F2E3A
MKYVIFFLAGLLIHLIFFYSIFDIYFTSPLVHGMTPQYNPLPAPAKRLVLFVADGLRADKAFESDEDQRPRAPFLRNIIKYEGAWGVSHTHVPTESRPGHVALIAGFYEDVSAVARGWKENPVPFDSVFNESRYTWSWGSPDILPMFAKGATGDHVYMDMYDADVEDFAGADLSKLDTWVFDKVKDFFQDARFNKSLSKKLNDDKVVFFLHLLGIDTNGHANRPNSEEYLHNIKVVDDGISEIVAHIEDYFKHDKQTAYVFTADHGMTNWGSHGAGHPHETLTPFIAWGAGVRKPSQPNNHYFKDEFSLAWKLGPIGRTDMNQADIAPLMSCLAGLPFPLNSVGILPTDVLGTTDQHKAESIWANTRQILANFNVKMDQRKSTTLSFMFKPFPDLQESHQIDIIRRIRFFLRNKRYEEVLYSCQDAIELALKGLHYYQTYDRFFLGTSVTLGFVGWMAYVIAVLIHDHTNIAKERLKFIQYDSKLYILAIDVFSAIIAAVVILLLFIQSLPFTHYIYCLLPVLLWNLVLKRFNDIGDLFGYIDEHRKFRSSFFLLVLWIIGLEIVVLTFFYREVLSVGLVLMSIWPFCTDIKGKDMVTALGWSISCLTLAIFPILPVVGREANYNLVSMASFLSFGVAIICARRAESGIMLSVRKRHKDFFVFCLTVCQIGMILLANYLVQDTANSIAAKNGLPRLNQILSWLILVSSFVIPMLSRTLISTRLFSIALALLPVYFLMSIAHEGMFCLCLCCLLYFWVQIENKQDKDSSKEMWNLDFIEAHSGSTQRALNLADFRRAYFFILLILLAFYGTGNIASINSFEPASVYCFLTVFNPFVMGAIMFTKILIPFILVTCTFQAIHIILQVPIKSLYLVVLIMSDFMALHFFFLVRDYGSWLEIGTSISHYTVMMGMIVFLMVLMLLARPLTTVSLRRVTNGNRKFHCS